jgi:hypothetical protein
MEVYPLVYTLNMATILPYTFQKTNVYVLDHLAHVLCNFLTQLALSSKAGYFGNNFSFMNPQRKNSQGLMSRSVHIHGIRIPTKSHMWTKDVKKCPR